VVKLLQVSFLLLSLAVPIGVARRARPERGVALTVGLFVVSVLTYVLLIGWVVPRLV
jgi:hypothetical protein